MKRKFPVLLLLVFFSAATAMAQDKQGIPVYEIARPDYDALGIRAGAFLIKPVLSLGMEHNDNIYATKDDKESDWITTLAPKIDIRSDWTRHSLGINVGLKSGFYSSESDENFLDGHIKLDGRLELLRESFLTGQAGFQYLHEARDEPDSNQAWSEPATYYRSDGKIAYYHGLGKLSASVGAGITRLDYRSVDLKAGGSENLDIRDYNTYDVNARFAYEMHPVVRPLIYTQYQWRRYDKSEAERDSDGYRIALGTGFDLTGLISGEIFAGYMQQNYDQRDNFSGPWYGMSLLWNVTGMTSVEGTVRKSIKETTEGNSSGIDALDTGLRVDHELLPNLLVGAFFDYTQDSYQDIDISDKYYNFGPRLTYLWNRNLSAEIKFTSNTCVSNLEDREYTENKFLFSLTGKL